MVYSLAGAPSRVNIRCPNWCKRNINMGYTILRIGYEGTIVLLNEGETEKSYKTVNSKHYIILIQALSLWLSKQDNWPVFCMIELRNYGFTVVRINNDQISRLPFP